MWTNQRTQQGDTLVSLARAYNVPVDKLLAANSIRSPKEHTDRYLSTRAQECMIPSNLPRKTLSKLILEHDIQRWVHNVGGECTPLRIGSKADMMRLAACSPGEFCHFSSESIINLPQKKRLTALAGLGAVSVVGTVNYLNDVKKWATTFGKYVVDNADFGKGDDAEDWRDNFVQIMNIRVDAALRSDSNGNPAFMRDPSLIQRVSDFAASQFADAKRFNVSMADQLSAMLSDLAAKTATALRSLASVLDSQEASTPATTPTPAARKDTSALAAVRAGTATLKKGAKGAAVTELQTMLQKVGLAVIVDADFGNNTKGGVEDFQKFRNLTVNGVLDAVTLRDLDAVVAAGGKVTGGRSASRPRRAAAPAATPVAVPAVIEPVAPPAQTRSSNTLVYAAIGFAVLLVAGTAVARRR